MTRLGARGVTLGGHVNGEDLSLPKFDPFWARAAEMGELVFTSLTKEALPIIRYRTRDLTRLLPGTARTMRRMDKITGRSDDMLIIRGVNVFPTQIEERVLAVDGLAPHYQIRVSREGRLDVMTVCVEKAIEEIGRSHV